MSELTATQFEYEGGVYEVGHETIRTRMNAPRIKRLTIGDSLDPDYLKYFRMFLQLIGNTHHVSGERSLPVVDVDITAHDGAITYAWNGFIDLDPTGWELDFFQAYFAATPAINELLKTPGALQELLETDEKKDGLTA